MSVDWYRRHLGTSQAPQRQHQVVPAPTQFVVVDGRAYPRGDADASGAPDGQGYSAQPWNQPVGDVPIGQVKAGDAIRVWKGTREAHQATAEGPCPHCGSRDYMPRMPTGRLGHCLYCGYRPATGDDRGGPTIQPRVSGGVSVDGTPIPVEVARSTGQRFGDMVSGRFSSADLVGKA